MAYTNGGMWGGKSDAICIATSDDGLHWKKPQVGLFAWDGSMANNIVLTDATQGTMFRDPIPAVPADEQYKYIAFSMQRGSMFTRRRMDGTGSETKRLPCPSIAAVARRPFGTTSAEFHCLFIRHEGAWTDVGGPGRRLAWLRRSRTTQTLAVPASSNPGVRHGIFTLPSVTQELPIVIPPNNYGQPYRSTAVKYGGRLMRMSPSLGL